MAVPKKRTSRRRRDMRRAHDALNATAAIQTCTACGNPSLRHKVCECGFYRGAQVFEPKGAQVEDAVEASE